MSDVTNFAATFVNRFDKKSCNRKDAFIIGFFCNFEKKIGRIGNTEYVLLYLMLFSSGNSFLHSNFLTSKKKNTAEVL